MKMDNHHKSSKFYSCRKAIPVMLKFRFSLLKYLIQRKKYPLFILRSDKGGILKTYEIRKKLRLNKFVGFHNHYYFSLSVPHWPSKAFDNMVANGGLNIAMAGTAKKKQIDTVILGITRKCNYKCNHCYEHFNLSDSETVPLAKWKKVISELQESGVSIITLSGGEPMMRYEEVLEMLRSADHSRSDFHIHTSGYGVTSERACELKKAGLQAAGVGLDDCDPVRNDKLRGMNGAHEQALNAIRHFQNAGIFSYVNICLTKEFISSGELLKYLEMLKQLNVGIVRWLEPRPCGGYSDIDLSELLSPEEKNILTEFYIRTNTSAEFIDYPIISYEAFYEAPEHMGCTMGGNSQLYIDTLGNVEPCVFLPVSFGNIMNEDLIDILKRMKKAIYQPFKVSFPCVRLSTALKDKKNQGKSIPVSFEELSEEFESLSLQEI